MRTKRERNSRRLRRKRGIRKKIFGTPNRPRLTVYRSNKHMYAQIINDLEGHTLVAASTLDDDFGLDLEDPSKIDEARKVGELIAERAKQEDIEKVVFDRNGFIYHGRVKAVAEGAREAGLDF